MEKEVPLRFGPQEKMEFETVEQLKEYLNSDTSTRRMKFAVRVFYVLQRTKQHPDEMMKTGAIWCHDGIHFICNSQLLGEFLLIKPNTINTNFRSHSFTIENNQPPAIISEFPMLRDIRNWRKRYNPYYQFTANSKESDVVAIPCKPPTSDIIIDRSRINNTTSSSSSNSQNPSNAISLSSAQSSQSTGPLIQSFGIFSSQQFQAPRTIPGMPGFSVSIGHDSGASSQINTIDDSHDSQSSECVATIRFPPIVPTKSKNMLPKIFNPNPEQNGKKSVSIPIAIPQNQTDNETSQMDRPAIVYPPRIQHKRQESRSIRSLLPEAVYNFVINDYQAFLETELIYSKLKKSPQTNNLILFEAMKEWLNFSESPNTSFENVCAFISQGIPDEYKEKLSNNIAILLKGSGSNEGESISFASFVKFVAQYGFVPQCQKNLIELSSPRENESFSTWFQPNLTDNAAVQKLSQEPSLSNWILRPSSVIGMFVLHYYSNGNLVTSLIDYNPTADMKRDCSFSMIGEKEGLIQASSIRHLLFDILDLPLKEDPKPL